GTDGLAVAELEGPRAGVLQSGDERGVGQICHWYHGTKITDAGDPRNAFEPSAPPWRILRLDAQGPAGRSAADIGAPRARAREPRGRAQPWRAGAAEDGRGARTGGRGAASGRRSTDHQRADPTRLGTDARIRGAA